MDDFDEHIDGYVSNLKLNHHEIDQSHNQSDFILGQNVSKDVKQFQRDDKLKALREIYGDNFDFRDYGDNFDFRDYDD